MIRKIYLLLVFVVSIFTAVAILSDLGDAIAIKSWENVASPTEKAMAKELEADLASASRGDLITFESPLRPHHCMVDGVRGRKIEYSCGFSQYLHKESIAVIARTAKGIVHTGDPSYDRILRDPYELRQ